jgi:hypothetical protein
MNNETLSMAVPRVAPEHKVNLTIEETCGVFGIGQHTLRKLVRSNPNADYLLRVGTKTLIKRSVFESYILKESVLQY